VEAPRRSITWGWWRSNNLDDHARARDLYEESVSLFRAAQDRWATARVLRKLGQLAMERLDFQRATGPLEESLRIAREVGQRRVLPSPSACWGAVVLPGRCRTRKSFTR